MNRQLAYLCALKGFQKRQGQRNFLKDQFKFLCSQIVSLLSVWIYY